jgi:hypothetical protein
MNSKNAIERIMKVLGLTPEKFYEGKTEQGLAIKMEGELELGQKVYVSTEEGLIPAPPGVHMLDDGSSLEVDDEGNLIKIDMGDSQKTMDEKKEEEIDKDSIKDETMAEKFGDVNLKDGSIMRVGGVEPSVGLRVKKISYDGTLVAMTDGDYETDGGDVISIVGGSIEGIQSKADYEKRKTGFAIAETADGVKVESPSFDVGEEIYVLDGDEKKMAPDGEHQVVLKDESGNENKIRVISKDGKIVERENVEEKPEDMEDTMMEIASQFQKALSKFESKIDLIAQKQKELESKFQKFSKEPAGSRVFTQKTINETQNPLETKYQGFRKLRQELGVK